MQTTTNSDKMTDYTAINMSSAPLAEEDEEEVDEIDGGVRQTLQTRSNFNRKPSPTNRSRDKPSNGKSEAIPLVNKRGSKSELESKLKMLHSSRRFYYIFLSLLHLSIVLLHLKFLDWFYKRPEKLY